MMNIFQKSDSEHDNRNAFSRSSAVQAAPPRADENLTPITCMAALFFDLLS
jgi:hypothetical protein